MLYLSKWPKCKKAVHTTHIHRLQMSVEFDPLDLVAQSVSSELIHGRTSLLFLIFMPPRHRIYSAHRQIIQVFVISLPTLVMFHQLVILDTYCRTRLQIGKDCVTKGPLPAMSYKILLRVNKTMIIFVLWLRNLTLHHTAQVRKRIT